ncbi:MAG: hypothetical protein ACOX3S_04305 [Anaerolineae bacterium]
MSTAPFIARLPRAVRVAGVSLGALVDERPVPRRPAPCWTALPCRSIMAATRDSQRSCHDP